MHFLLIINSHLINSHKPINPLFGLNNFQLYFCRLRLIMTFRLMSFTLCFSLLLEQAAQHSLTGWKQPCPLSQTLTLIQSLPRSSSVVLHQCVGLWLPTWHYHTFSRNPVPAWFWVRVDQETNLHKIWKLKVRRTLPLEGHGGQMRQPRARCKGPHWPGWSAFCSCFRRHLSLWPPALPAPHGPRPTTTCLTMRLKMSPSSQLLLQAFTYFPKPVFRLDLVINCISDLYFPLPDLHLNTSPTFL